MDRCTVNDQTISLSLLPEDVAVAPGVVAAGLRVELVAAGVPLDYVSGGALLDVYALVSAGGDAVPPHGVVVGVVGAVGPLSSFGLAGGGG